MTDSLGQVVYLFKDKMGRARLRTNCHNPAMPKEARAAVLPDTQTAGRWKAPPESLLLAAMKHRIKEARERAKMTQDAVAQSLGISQTRYSKYETRSWLPHVYLSRFCDVTDYSLEKLLKDPR